MIGWQSRIFYLTRDPKFILRGAVLILVVCFMIAISLSRPISAPSLPLHLSAVEEIYATDDEGAVAWVEQIKESYHRLAQSSGSPDLVAEWLRDVASKRDTVAREWRFDPAQLRLREFDLSALFDTHTKGDAQKDLFGEYARVLLLKDEVSRGEARLRLEMAARNHPSLRFSHEFSGDLFGREGNQRQALEEYLKEGMVPDATRARRLAWRIAAVREDEAAFRKMLGDERFRRDASPSQLFLAARLAGNFVLAAGAFVRMELAEWTHPEALLAMFAVGLWYFIMVYAGSNLRYRWYIQLLAVGAGVMSTWLIHWGHLVLKYSQGDGSGLPAGAAAMYYIVYVGLPEETAKLLLFCPFLFWLLRRRVRSDVALTAGCVGLGFALAENIQYYMREGPGTALGRMVTANFLHMALTGLLGVRLYDWFRARCHGTGEFMTAYACVVLAHGVYDFGCSEQAAAMQMGIIRILTLALTARYYFKEWQPELRHQPRQVVSSISVFTFGCALLVGVVMIVCGITGDRREVYMALVNAVTLAPVTWIFVREFHQA